MRLIHIDQNWGNPKYLVKYIETDCLENVFVCSSPYLTLIQPDFKKDLVRQN